MVDCRIQLCTVLYSLQTCSRLFVVIHHVGRSSISLDIYSVVGHPPKLSTRPLSVHRALPILIAPSADDDYYDRPSSWSGLVCFDVVWSESVSLVLYSQFCFRLHLVFFSPSLSVSPILIQLLYTIYSSRTICLCPFFFYVLPVVYYMIYSNYQKSNPST